LPFPLLPLHFLLLAHILVDTSHLCHHWILIIITFLLHFSLWLHKEDLHGIFHFITIFYLHIFKRLHLHSHKGHITGFLTGILNLSILGVNFLLDVLNFDCPVGVVQEHGLEGGGHRGGGLGPGAPHRHALHHLHYQTVS